MARGNQEKFLALLEAAVAQRNPAFEVTQAGEWANTGTWSIASADSFTAPRMIIRYNFQGNDATLHVRIAGAEMPERECRFDFLAGSLLWWPERGHTRIGDNRTGRITDLIEWAIAAIPPGRKTRGPKGGR